ncbi:MAG: phytanoyl-CoA dioxygenase family protein [Myxococcota bacterium]
MDPASSQTSSQETSPETASEPPLHPLNTGFRWMRAPGPPRMLRQEQVRSYDEQGFFVLESAFDSDTLARAIREIDAFEAATEAILERAPGGRISIARAGEISFSVHLVMRSEWLRAFCAGEVFRGLVGDLIGPDVRLYWDQAVYKKPGTTAPFPWHQDNGYTFIEPQQYLTCWVALTDATERNGCPWVAPGMHRRGTLAHRESDLGFVCFDGEPEGARPVPARAGDVVVFSSLTPHATGPNLTDSVRKAYIVQFTPDGARLLLRDGAGAVTKVAAAHPERQFPILRAGRAPAEAV